MSLQNSFWICSFIPDLLLHSLWARIWSCSPPGAISMTDTSLDEGIDETRSWVPLELPQQRIQEEINDVKVWSDISVTAIFFPQMLLLKVMTHFLKLLVSKDLAENLHLFFFFSFTAENLCGCFKRPVWEITQLTVQPVFQETSMPRMVQYRLLPPLGYVHTAKRHLLQEMVPSSQAKSYRIFVFIHIVL